MTSQINISNMNSVHRSTVNDSSSVDSAVHLWQVNLDRHHVAVLKMGRWNVKILFQSQQLDNIKLKLYRLAVNIMAISQVRWTGAVTINMNGYKFVNSGGLHNENWQSVTLHSEQAKVILGFWAISDGDLLLKIKGSPLNVCYVQMNAQHPTALTELLSHSMKYSKSLQTVSIPTSSNLL